MAANTNPIFGRAADVQLGGAVLGPSANTAQDGTGANITSIFQADATEGGFVDEVRLKPVGSPAATVVRVFVCTVTGALTPGTTNTAANTALLAELSLAAVTSSNTLAQNDISFPIRKALPAGYRLLMTFGTSTGAAGTGYAVTTFAAKY
jgi:hypothetical protein